MERNSFWVAFIASLFLLRMVNCVDYEVKSTMILFLAQLSGNDSHQNFTLNWKLGSDPCIDQWQGVECDTKNSSIKNLLLDKLSLSGTLDVAMLCNLHPLAASLTYLSLDGNGVHGGIPEEIGSCKQLTQLQLSGNQLSGTLPSSLSKLNNLKSLDISNNKFSGQLHPDLARISTLNMFLAQNNQLSGEIPPFNFSNFDRFDVSFNNFSGVIPDIHGHFTSESFLGNPQLCGDPLPKSCTGSPVPASKDSEERKESPVPAAAAGDNADERPKKSSKGPSKEQILMYSGYAAIGALVILLIVWKLCRRKKKEKRIEALNEKVETQGSAQKASHVSSEYRAGVSRSDFSLTSESGMVSQSLVVLSNSRNSMHELKLEDLLKAPAELIGRGKNGSLYKVILENGTTVVVKRIIDRSVPGRDFKQRMQILSQVKHPYVLSPLAFYCSKQEKLLVYEYQQNGSLFKLLHGAQKSFDWSSRLGIAATTAEALAFMHQELGQQGISHGNLKSSNILLNKNMEPCISEYGVMGGDDDQQQQHSSSFVSPFTSMSSSDHAAFKADVYGFGVILLELLTGKLVKSEGMELTEWVQSVVREEWTGEVFDRTLISEYASEERMVNLLQVAIRCVNRSPEARPSINQVALIINTIKEEEEKSLIYQV
ncbi:probable inactive receptor kinase At2g26730 [Arachis stenosperma]|uniref:probable inactive receptor kinase At2g26730 n=1 Tax=Arachis stenosperma TaxID=217475 RepID=UPI0025AC0D7C|nr:probable inactive receptor kinase At2g26730 [Arachis stenosperma]